MTRPENNSKVSAIIFFSYASTRSFSGDLGVPNAFDFKSFRKKIGLFSRFADYTYSLDKNNLLDYSLEQQATIVSDYWLLKTYGFSGHSYLVNYKDYNSNEPYSVLLKKYEKVLGSFPG